MQARKIFRRMPLRLEPLDNRIVPAAVRSYDGTGNNLQHPQWGSTGSDLLRIAPAEYGDGISTVGGADRPSARVISNSLAAQDEDVISDRFMSAMIYAWGQFLDHDIGLAPTGNSEIMKIAIPAGDPWFDPMNTGTQSITITRSEYNPNSGTSVNNPRRQLNDLTAFIDGSMVYGTDAATATALRTLQGGRMKVSAGDLLPFNNAATFPNGTLPMASFGPDPNTFAAGDSRANENPELLALHTLFVREHNHWADRIAAQQPKWSDEQIYQEARSIVIGEIEAITYNQWLPTVLGPDALRDYRGYNPRVNPQLANEFSTAAFRFGHSLLGDDIEFFDNNGIAIADEVSLAESFFNPALVVENGIDSILKYLSSDPSSELDNKVVDGVRNFLFGPPGAGGLDLASLNIQRGRDHGLADYNRVRQAYGLPKVTSFSQITSNTDVQDKLEDLYGTVDNIDLWVGALAEDHVDGASVGPTLRRIFIDQFSRIRDGDRFWYENSRDRRMVEQISRTTLTDVMRRNTTLSNLQQNAFVFKADIAGQAFADMNRNGKLDRGEQSMAGRTVTLVNVVDNEVVATTTTDIKGHYHFGVAEGLRTGQYQVIVSAPPGMVRTTPNRVIAITRGDMFVGNVNTGFAFVMPPPPGPGPGQNPPTGPGPGQGPGGPGNNLPPPPPGGHMGP